MAKLTGVKTLDMQNGETMRISYEGATYERAADPLVGDIVLVVEPWGSIEVGDYYVVTTVSELGDVAYAHFKGGDYDCANNRTDKMRAFRKVGAAQTPGEVNAGRLIERLNNVEARVDALEGKAEKPALKVGDHVKILSAGEFGGVDVGDCGVIDREIDEDGQYRVTGEYDHGYFYPNQMMKVDVEVAAAIGRKANEYRAGDVVKGELAFRRGQFEYGEVAEAPSVSILGVRIINAQGAVRTLVHDSVELIAPVDARFDRQ
jgi:hypothetical protein